MSFFSRLFGDRGTQGDCIARALYQGWIHGKQRKMPVRFVIKNISPGVDHIQCQYNVGTKDSPAWLWSSQTRDFAHEGKDDFPDAKVIKVLTFAEFLKERLEAEK